MSARILIGRVDVTEHVAAMFDALVGSLDWGSGFLDVETVESILIVAELAGFDVNGFDVKRQLEAPKGLVPSLPPYPMLPDAALMPPGGWPTDRPEVWEEAQRLREEHRAEQNRVDDERKRMIEEAIARWRAQLGARVAAMPAEAQQEDEEEDQDAADTSHSYVKATDHQHRNCECCAVCGRDPRNSVHQS